VLNLVPAIVVAGLVFGGVVALTTGACLFVGTLRFLSRAVPLTGRVTDYEFRRSDNPDGPCGYYHPTVEFEDETGQPHRVTLSLGGSTRTHDVGVPVALLFDPACPDRTRMCSFVHLWFFPLAFTTSGALGLAGGIGFGVAFGVF
jgi:hypothetical protein